MHAARLWSEENRALSLLIADVRNPKELVAFSFFTGLMLRDFPSQKR